MSPSTHPSTFRETVAEVAARAKERLPEAVNGRIESAVKLVLAHDVTPQEDGSIVVGSSSDPLKTYRLEGHTCTCQDFVHGQAPEGWCRHRIAAGIQKRVTQVLATPPVPVVPEDLPEPWPDNDPEEPPPAPPVPAPTPGPCPEALFSLTLKGTLDGQEALLTARGQTAAEFKRNLEAIRGLLDPGRRVEAQRAPQGQGWCGLHQVQMRLNRGKDGQSDWYSHRTRELQWCKGK